MPFEWFYDGIKSHPVITIIRLWTRMFRLDMNRLKWKYKLIWQLTYFIIKKETAHWNAQVKLFFLLLNKNFLIADASG